VLLLLLLISLLSGSLLPLKVDSSAAPKVV